MKRIEVPGMGIVEFPDGMSDDQIAGAIRANMPKDTGAQQQAASTGAGEALLVGAGKKTNDILNGLTQIYLKARGEASALGGLAQNAEMDPAYAALKKERPFVTGVGESLPAMAVPGAGASYGGAMLAGALPEALSYGSAQDRLTKGAVGATGGAAGRAAAGLIGTALKPAGVGVNPNKEAMEAAKRIGFKPLAGQATQNPALLNIENYLARSPGSSGAMQALTRQNQTAVNRAAAGSIRQSADDVGPGILSAGEKAIGADFKRLEGVTSPNLGADFLNSLVGIEQANAARGPFRDSAIDSLLGKALDLGAQGNLSGKAYKEIRTELSNQATKAFKGGDATLGQAVKGVREALDTAAEQSLSGADQAAWKAARQDWGNFKALTKGLVSEAGDVSPARVAQQLRATPGFRTGQTSGPLTDIARIGEGIKSALNPNSGNLNQMMLYGNPVTGLPMMAGNAVGGAIYRSPAVQAYLRNGILDLGPKGELVLRASGVPVGDGVLKQLLGVE